MGIQPIALPQHAVAPHKKILRKHYVPLLAADPTEDPDEFWEVLVSNDRWKRTAFRGEAATYELLETVRWMLLSPNHIYRCKRDDGDAENGWCYFGIPSRAFGNDKPGGTRAKIYPPYPNQVFMVFVDEERVVCNWYWHDSDPDVMDHPLDYQNRFGEKCL